MPASYTAGIGDDIARRKAGGFDAAPMVNDQNPYLQQPQSMMAPQMEQPKPKGGGLFGKQSALWKVLGTLGDGLTGNPVYGQMQQQERQTLMQQERERQRAEDAQRAQMEERQYDRDDYLFKQDYEAKNPPARYNDTAADLALYETWTPEQRRMYHEMKPTVSTRADGSPFVVNPYDLQQPTQQTATNPQTGEKLVLKDGQWVPIGGPVQQAPGNFPQSTTR